jgi:GH18 family chitinase
MTYDLHGQWDAGNKHANPGCEIGNCFRSHVKLTEINYALSMVTKAGVPVKTIFVGFASYGRSFKMAKVGCKTEECKFLGDSRNNPAAKG